ncbi:MAG: Gfo/Idh/MocA family oxidoreductase [Planctomycetia bacterium]|nr:Gfo/Idh/MocA family oxidoreductase [Planctomycetia bacterium]
MNLTPQQQAAAKEEFARVSRREFLIASSAAVATTGLTSGAFYFGYGKAEGDPVRVAILGTGDEGNILIGALNPEYVEVRSIADIRPYNVFRAFHGDNANDTIIAMRKGLMNVYGWKTEDEARKHVKVYGRYEDCLANAIEDGVEAVIIALPLHLHAVAAIKAMRLGLHVLTEKLMARTVAQCKEMARVAALENKLLATGHQRHYNILYEEAMETIKRGTIGDLHYIGAQWHRGNLPGTDSWQMPMPYEVSPKDPQAMRLLNDLKSLRVKLNRASGAEIDRLQLRVKQKELQIRDHLVDAAKFGYEAFELKETDGSVVYRGTALEELIRWRLCGRTGGGLMVELGSHQLDAASIFISALHGGAHQHPISVAASGCRNLFRYDRDTNDHIVCAFEYPLPGYDPKDDQLKRLKIGVQYATINGNGFGGYGEVVYGTKGTLIIRTEKEALLLRKDAATKASAAASAGPTMDTQSSGASQSAAATTAVRDVSRGYAEEIEHFAWCIRHPAPENKPRCYPEVAMADAIIAHVTNISALNSERIYFKDEWFLVDSDETPEGDKPNIDKEEYK